MREKMAPDFLHVLLVRPAAKAIRVTGSEGQSCVRITRAVQSGRKGAEAAGGLTCPI